MSTDGDYYAYEQAMSAGPSEELPFVSKRNLWIGDASNGSYASNQIRFDLSQCLSSTQNMIDLSQATLEIPVVQILSGLPAGTTSGLDSHSD